MTSNNKKYVMTIDQGTTSCRTLIVDKSGKVISTEQITFTQFFPDSGWVEHDPKEIWDSQLRTIQLALKKGRVSFDELAAIGITNQRETIVVWERATGNAVYNAIVWQDQRTADYCDKLSSDPKLVEKIREKTGLILNPYFSATKLKWILDNIEDGRQRAERGELLAGTIDTWLIWNLTGGAVHATDVSNASRTLLCNITTCQWDLELLELFNIPIDILPKIMSSSEIYGYTATNLLSRQAPNALVPISGVAGDQQAALFGQLCFNEGEAKNTYGTGCFMLTNVGTKPLMSKHNLLTTVAWKLGKDKVYYALEGSVFIAGAAIKWLRDGLRIIYESSEVDYYARLLDDSQNDNMHVYVVPAFTGLGAPYWDTHSRGAIMGIERGTKREHIVKSTVESIAYQTYDLLTAMEKDIGKKIQVLKVDGGACKSDYLMQFQSSILKTKIKRPVNRETTAMGAAYLAGLAVGFWKDVNEIKTIEKIEKEFMPNLPENRVKLLLRGWAAAVKRTVGWTKEFE